MASFKGGRGYHEDSDADADDEFERSVVASPNAAHTDDETSSESHSTEHTPTHYGGFEDGNLPREIISLWTNDDCASFISQRGFRQYSDSFIEHEVDGAVLIALGHSELKEMGVASAGHRLKILKEVYEIKVAQDVEVEEDHYVPLSAERNPRHDQATKDDILKLTDAFLRLRDDRIRELEAQLTKLADDTRRLRQELIPLTKTAEESKPPPIPHKTAYGAEYMPDPTSSVSTAEQEPTSNGILNKSAKNSLTRTFSKKLGLGSGTSKQSPTHFQVIHERPEQFGIQPSAAASAAANSLTAGMSGGPLQSHSPNMPSPTSPMPYQPLAPRSYQRDGSGLARHDPATTDDKSQPTPPLSFNYDTSRTPTYKTSTISNASTLVPSREMSQSVPPQTSQGSSARGIHSVQSGPAAAFLNTSNHLPFRNDPSISNPTSSTPASTTNANTPNHTSSNNPPPSGEDPAVSIFKSFRVALDDPCYKVLPAALQKYKIQADWRQYALYIVYGDQERCVGLDERPLVLFKDLDREGKKPMFMLRKLANPGLVPSVGGMGPAGSTDVPVTSLGGIARPGTVPPGMGGGTAMGLGNIGSSAGGGGGGGGGGLPSSAASVRALQAGLNLPGGIL